MWYVFKLAYNLKYNLGMYGIMVLSEKHIIIQHIPVLIIIQTATFFYIIHNKTIAGYNLATEK